MSDQRSFRSETLGGIGDTFDLVVVDCLTLWVGNLLLSGTLGEDVEAEAMCQARALLSAYERGRASWIVISNEVGLGPVPSTPTGRQYRDALGRVNSIMAAAADQVVLMVAGVPLFVKGMANSGESSPTGEISVYG